MFHQIRFFTTRAIFIPAKSRIQLTEAESDLFSSILKCLPGTEVRVAGGWVRDKLLNLNSQDIDISLNNMTGTQAANILRSSLSNSRSFGISRLNPEASKHLETACIKISNYQIDFVNLRSEVYADSRIPTIVRVNRLLDLLQKMHLEGI